MTPSRKFCFFGALTCLVLRNSYLEGWIISHELCPKHSLIESYSLCKNKEEEMNMNLPSCFFVRISYDRNPVKWNLIGQPKQLSYAMWKTFLNPANEQAHLCCWRIRALSSNFPCVALPKMKIENHCKFGTIDFTFDPIDLLERRNWVGRWSWCFDTLEQSESTIRSSLMKNYSFGPDLNFCSSLLPTEQWWTSVRKTLVNNCHVYLIRCYNQTPRDIRA